MTAAIWQAIERLTRCFADRSTLHDQRLAALENRVAELDAGPDAQASARSALNAANHQRTIAGQEPLALRLTDAGAKFIDRGTGGKNPPVEGRVYEH